LAAVQPVMERMFVVIAIFADLAQAGFKGLAAHIVISCPS
jgi:hypothetical protein